MFNLSFLSVLIDAAVNEFNQMIEEEIRRRIKEQESHDQPDKPKKTPKVHKKKDETTEAPNEVEVEETASTSGTETGAALSNGISNGHHENGHVVNGSGDGHEMPDEMWRELIWITRSMNFLRSIPWVWCHNSQS